MNSVQLIITDFDGTLVDTFEANFRAYEKAFAINGLVLSKEEYQTCFGLRFDAFLEKMGITDEYIKKNIRKDKASIYPEFFEWLQPNNTLISFIRSFRKSGCKTAVASTASRENLINIFQLLKLDDAFDLILAGEDVTHSKPHPEIYVKAMEMLKVPPEQTIIFEDTQIGFEAATAAGAKYIHINKLFYGN